MMKRALLGATTALITALPVLAAPTAGAQPACDPFTRPTVEESVPTAREVLGFDLGQREVTTAESDRYLRAVADSSPKVTDDVLATSTQGRPLRYAVVGEPENITRAALAGIGRKLNLLRDPKTPEPVARRIIEGTPSVLWVAGNVHGDEESGTGAALRVLYELTARTDCTAPSILDDAVVVVLPTQNPDGRELDTRRTATGFDANRDWFARTQPETDGKLEKLRELPPQMFVDAHEMGSDDYFFPPNADPVYHDIGEIPLDWVYNRYGPAMQRSFQRFGIPYFNGSSYDLMYMGYGDTVPLTGFNAAGMTFEKNEDDPIAQRVEEHYTAIWSTLMSAGAQNAELREQWRAEHLEAYRQGEAGELEPNRLYWNDDEITNPVPDIRVKHYFLRTDDPAEAEGVQRLARRLQRMDVDVHRLTVPLTVPDYTPYGRSARETTLPAGALWVPLAQGQKHWIQAMLAESSYVPFPYFYDVTAWSGPLLENLDGGRSGADLNPVAAPLPPQPEPGARVLGAPKTAVWQTSGDSAAVESAGWLRHWLGEHRVDFGDLTARQIADGALSEYGALVIPNGDGDAAFQALGPAGREALTEWVRGGGRLVALRDSATLATRLGLTSATHAEPTSDVPGALIRTELDPASPLAEGVGPTVWSMYEYDQVWTAPPEVSAARFPEAGDPDWYVSGFAEGAEELHGKTAVVDENLGAGRVVLFGFEPNYRAFTNGSARLLGNALAGDRSDVPARSAIAARQGPTDSAAGRLVLSVRPEAADRVRGMLERRGAEFTESAAGRFLVDLGGMTADEHPWARDLAGEVAGLGRAVRAIRLP